MSGSSQGCCMRETDCKQIRPGWSVGPDGLERQVKSSDMFVPAGMRAFSSFHRQDSTAPLWLNDGTWLKYLLVCPLRTRWHSIHKSHIDHGAKSNSQRVYRGDSGEQPLISFTVHIFHIVHTMAADASPGTLKLTKAHEAREQ